MAVCAGLNPYFGLIGAIIASLVLKVNGKQSVMPMLASFSVFTFILSTYGMPIACLSTLFCGVFLIITAFLGPDFRYLVFKPAVTAIMLATAISITVLQTTNYFGIGATGNDIAQMLASYTSLGFHPNWRSVLYGTIVLVLMITYPKKFKKLENTVRAPFVAIIFTVLLNIALNPEASQSAIAEIDNYNFTISQIFLRIRDFEFNLANIGTSFIYGIALYIPAVYSLFNAESKNEDYLISGVMNIGASFASVFVSGKTRNKNDLSFAGIISAIMIVAVSLIFKDLIVRIPFSTCAVILIVSAWQSVRWNFFKSIFNDVASIACFLTTLAFSLLFGITGGILFGAAFSCFCKLLPGISKINNVIE